MYESFNSISFMCDRDKGKTLILTYPLGAPINKEGKLSNKILIDLK